MYLGIDIGGSNIKLALVTAEGKKKNVAVVTTPRRKKRFLAVLGGAIHAFVAGRALRGIGVGIPGIVDPRKGTLVNAPNLPFLNGWNVKNFFKKFHIPVRVDNDSRCFLRAEAAFGAGRGHRHIAILTVGTGVGGGLFIDGQVYFGSRSGAGEFGHMIVNHGKTLEQLAGKEAFEKHGDRSEIVGIGVANIVNAFDPEIIILGGGGIFQKTLQIQKIRSVAKRHIMSPMGKHVRIVRGKLGEYAGAIGAMLLFRTKS
jgi:glucokinase